jgi:hypothetical protein
MKGKTPKSVSDYMKRMGRKGGKKAAENMLPEERSERAKKAVAAREERKRNNA